jgi:glycosyltransferase involved in cell wall biosynthesis
MLPSVFNNPVGLSVLIPVYNFNVTSLVQALSVQLQKTGNEGEIILLDDGSSPETLPVNQSLKNIPFVIYNQNEKNEGRMAARQRLSGLARYDYLLFLDCDSEIINDDFLASYFSLIKENILLASGGRIYTDAALEIWKKKRKQDRKTRSRIPIQ